jgi:Transposase DDE domain
MRRIPQIVMAVEGLFGTWAQEANRVCRVVRRKRKFTPMSLAQTLVLGFLAKPKASDKELAEMAALCGVAVTPQAIGQRFTPQFVEFAEQLLRQAIGSVVGAKTALAPLLARFPQVFVLDSTVIRLPDTLRERFPGCGGSYGSGQAAMKIQVQWDLCSGAWHAVSLEAGRDCDYKTPLQSAPLPAGSLRIADLGYFDTEVFERISQNGAFWLSRLQFGTAVFTPEGSPWPLLAWLAQQPETVVDRPVRIGSERKVFARVLAWRVPQEVADRRRQKLIVEARRKSGRTPGAERLAWCDWTILITNVPAEKLTLREAAVLYRARWQIELLFKRWKSLGKVGEFGAAPVVRQMAQLWLRLLAVVVEHWIVLSTSWGDARVSLMKASQCIRRHAGLLAGALGKRDQLEALLEIMRGAIRSTAQFNKRKRPRTFELLNDPSLLEYPLT